MTEKEKTQSTNEYTLRQQVAALPFRISESKSIEILLITSRDTGRFIIPKGWRKKGQKKSDSAAREAYEEAGLVGKLGRKRCIFQPAAPVVPAADGHSVRLNCGVA
ncbi:NUDIX hydrolase [Sinorhizobium fredii]|uniref:NUDIX hydrolase domain-containing protein n=1 Tax=Rhizobium fredii TaxID=380 RepID=A0A2L0HAD6_RHIFR|nr:NUDIX hydrolase domain-containing protein [Sinorhizobium fredii]